MTRGFAGPKVLNESFRTSEDLNDSFRTSGAPGTWGAS